VRGNTKQSSYVLINERNYYSQNQLLKTITEMIIVLYHR